MSSLWIWSVAAGLFAVVVRLIAPGEAMHAVLDGADVYAYLLGILAIAEIARVTQLFDWAAAHVLRLAAGSRRRLFVMVYGVGIAVTALLSNDTTIVVLTPAVLAVLSRTDAPPLPYLYACAFVANAASFVLPISNPANLVFFGQALPSLVPWLAAFGLSSVAAIAFTWLLLFVAMRRGLDGTFAADVQPRRIASEGRLAAWLVGASVLALVAAAWTGLDVGYTALACAAVSLTALAVRARERAAEALRGVSWQIVPFVAGLFTIVAALDRHGAIAVAMRLLQHASALPGVESHLLVGAATSGVANLANNLPAGVIARAAVRSMALHPGVTHAMLVGIDLGPNLSTSGSLATLLWLAILRREAILVTPWQFLRVGAIVLVPALCVTLLLVR